MNLTGQPIYQKGQKPAKAKGIRKVSAKRAAHNAQEREAGGEAHMLAVKALGCLICGVVPAEAHHLQGGTRSAFRTIPLCPFHHRREYGPQAYHYSRRNFNAAHGSDDELLARTLAQLKGETE